MTTVCPFTTSVTRTSDDCSTAAIENTATQAMTEVRSCCILLTPFGLYWMVRSRQMQLAGRTAVRVRGGRREVRGPRSEVRGSEGPRVRGYEGPTSGVRRRR